MNAKRPLFCIVGKSGSGKSTIANTLVEEFDMTQVESYTTRPKRDNELGGHTFINDMDTYKFKEDEIVAYGVYGGYKYFATKEQLNSSDIYVVDKQGLESMQNLYVGEDANRIPIVIYLKTSFLVRLKRLVRDNGWRDGLKRMFRDIGKFKHIDNKHLDYCVFTFENNSINRIPRICDIIYRIQNDSRMRLFIRLLSK